MSDRDIMDTFKDYVGVKLHFNSEKFIYSSPRQLSKYSVQTLKKRKDVRQFIRLSEKFTTPEERLQFIISQFKYNKNAWVGDFFAPLADKIHDSRMKVVNSLDYYVAQDIDTIINKHEGKSINDIIKVNHDRPQLYKDGIYKDETLSIIDSLYNFDTESFNPLWSEKLLMFRKYNSYLHNDDLVAKIGDKLNVAFTLSSVNESIEKKNTLEHLFS